MICALVCPGRGSKRSTGCPRTVLPAGAFFSSTTSLATWELLHAIELTVGLSGDDARCNPNKRLVSRFKRHLHAGAVLYVNLASLRLVEVLLHLLSLAFLARLLDP